MTVRTRTVRDRLVGQARKELKDAAGSNQVLSRTEAKKLSKDVARSAEVVRGEKGRVTVSDAVDEYASKVSKVLTAVDVRGKGNLSQSEVNAIRDPALRGRVHDVRASLLRGDTPAVGNSAALLAAMAGPMGPLEAFHESGDHGVNITIRKVPGRTLDSVLDKVHLDPQAPWTHSETQVELRAETGDAAISTFNAFAAGDLESERDDMPDDIQGFTAAVTAQFSGLADVRLAHGKDLGAWYLVGKTSDGYVAIASQSYSD